MNTGFNVTPTRQGSALLLLVVLLLPACAGLRPGFETPSVTVSSFRALPSQGAMPNFEIGLQVTNPNAVALNLRGVTYGVSLGGYELIKGVGNDLPVIEAYGQGEFKLTASANLLAGMRLLGNLMSGPKDSVPYEFEAKLDIGALRPAIRVKDSGSISLQSFGAN
ncbi:MAG: LEA type 2 family protein [Woeseia sp.]